MEVRFRNRRLERCFEDEVEAYRAWGPVVGRRYVARVTGLTATDRVAELYGMNALGFHPLTGDRRGQYAIRLTGQMRLIISVQSDHVVTVEEVVDYHG